MIKAIYFQYYSWFYNIIKSDTAEYNSLIMLGGNIAFLVIAILDLITTYLAGYRIELWISLLIIFSTFIFFHFYYYRSGQTKSIISNKPLILKNKPISIIISILFNIFSWGFTFLIMTRNVDW
jgi:hypothetical protein